MKYSFKTALLCCSCYLALLALSLVPPQTIWGVELRRASILSDVVNFTADEEVAVELTLEIDEQEYEVNLEQVRQAVTAVEVSPSQAQSSYAWHAEGEEDLSAQNSKLLLSGASGAKLPLRLIPDGEITPIEDYDSLEVSALKRLYTKLLSPDSLVRIAVLGDSFIEADILTADLREALQTRFGGCGSGFTPIHSPLTVYRKTIKTNAKGWSSHNVMQRRKTPESLASLFSISGWISVPERGASTTWTTTAVRQHIDSCSRVKLHFVAKNDAQLSVSINGEEPHLFDVDGAEGLRQVEVEHPNIRSVSLVITKGESGFIGYGAYFESAAGVSVDNYSVRSNNGQAMFWTSPAINAQIGKALGGYDLVVLQYGLNIMQSGVNNYTRYSQQVEKMVAYAQSCFPGAAVVVMGVSDRSIKKDGSYKPMSEATHLTQYQRTAAQKAGVGFWDTYSAMQQQGGMVNFVSQGWAAKDFTHINFNGGRQVAWALVDALVEQVEVERAKIVVRTEHEPLIDSLANQTISSELQRPLNQGVR